MWEQSSVRFGALYAAASFVFSLQPHLPSVNILHHISVTYNIDIHCQITYQIMSRFLSCCETRVRLESLYGRQSVRHCLWTLVQPTPTRDDSNNLDILLNEKYKGRPITSSYSLNVIKTNRTFLNKSQECFGK